MLTIVPPPAKDVTMHCCMQPQSIIDPTMLMLVRVATVSSKTEKDQAALEGEYESTVQASS